MKHLNPELNYIHPKSPTATFITELMKFMGWSIVMLVVVISNMDDGNILNIGIALLFLIPIFPAIFKGLYQSLRTFLLISKPVPHLAYMGELVAGSKKTLNWYLTGKVEAIQDLEISLVAKEVIITGEGKAQQEEVTELLNLPLVYVNTPEKMQMDSATVTIPMNLEDIPAFNAETLWYLVVKGESPRWPHMLYELPILPVIGIRAAFSEIDDEDV